MIRRGSATIVADRVLSDGDAMAAMAATQKKRISRISHTGKKGGGGANDFSSPMFSNKIAPLDDGSYKSAHTEDNNNVSDKHVNLDNQAKNGDNDEKKNLPSSNDANMMILSRPLEPGKGATFTVSERVGRLKFNRQATGETGRFKM